jgi:hypothetical protein
MRNTFTNVQYYVGTASANGVCKVFCFSHRSEISRSCGPIIGTLETPGIEMLYLAETIPIIALFINIAFKKTISHRYHSVQHRIDLKFKHQFICPKGTYLPPGKVVCTDYLLGVAYRAGKLSRYIRANSYKFVNFYSPKHAKSNLYF